MMLNYRLKKLAYLFQNSYFCNQNWNNNLKNNKLI